MTKANRGKLAFKIAGIAWLVRIAPYVVPLWWPWISAGTRHWRGVTGGFKTIALSVLEVGFFVGPGICLIAFSRPLSAWLLGTDKEELPPAPKELLHTGAVLVALYFLFAYAHLALLAFVDWRGWIALALAGPLVLLLVGFPRRITRLLQWPLNRWRGVAVGRSGVLAAGFAVLGLFFCAKTIFQTAGSLVFWLESVGPDAEFGEWYRQALLRTLVSGGIGLVLGVALVLAAALLAGWLCRGRGRNVEDSDHGSIAPTSWVELAMFAGVAYLFGSCLKSLVQSPFFAWKGVHALGALVHFVALPTLVGAGIFFVARLALPPVAAWLWPREPGDPAESTARPLIALETAVTLVALYHVTGYLCHLISLQVAFEAEGPAVSTSLRVERLLASAAALGIVLFRGDIAWLMLGRKRDYPAVSSGHRRALLLPWLALLGVWHILAYGPAGVCYLILPRPVGGSFSSGQVGGVVGSIFLFAAGPLSRLLSHGRIIPRIWPRGPHIAASQSPST